MSACKPRPLDAARDWLAEHSADPLDGSYSNGDPLAEDYGSRPVVLLADIEDLRLHTAENLATGATGRRATLDLLRQVHLMISTLRREVDTDAPPQARSRERWNRPPATSCPGSRGRCSSGTASSRATESGS